jgi:4'-phosphopantetheinyl transferase
MISIINNPNSTAAYFRQDDYDQMIAGGINKRAVEKGGIQKLLQKLGYDGLEIVYKETGQPYFRQKPELFLSLSHAKGWFAVIVGSKPVGIDIQTVSQRLKQGQDYFRNERELPFSEDDQALHLIWGAKEAFYKLMEGQIPDLKEEVSLVSIGEESLIIEFKSEKHNLGYKILEEAFLVFTR